MSEPPDAVSAAAAAEEDEEAAAAAIAVSVGVVAIERETGATVSVRESTAARKERRCLPGADPCWAVLEAVVAVAAGDDGADGDAGTV